MRLYCITKRSPPDIEFANLSPPDLEKIGVSKKSRFLVIKDGRISNNKFEFHYQHPKNIGYYSAQRQGNTRSHDTDIAQVALVSQQAHDMTE